LDPDCQRNPNELVDSVVKRSPALQFHPLTRERWPDLEKLFGERGACGGCWCMFWRLPRTQWVRQKGVGNRRAFQQLVNSGEVPGLIAYAGGEPAGWCAFGPRECYPRLASARTLKPVDDQPVWSITCFFIARPQRRKGLSLALLKEAANYARRQGARIIEGYPSEAKKGYPDVFYYRGLLSAFRKAGFQEVARRSPASPIMRRTLRGMTNDPAERDQMTKE
jgi:GNAT superfamily N-acetyltransferase